jgi:very-short-patch-repair endonuclease
LGLLRPVQGSIDVTVPTRSGRRRRAGLRVHRVAGLTPRQCTQRKRIPVTTAARTIEDLAGMVPEWLVRRATRQAEIAGFPLGPGIETDGTRSDLETDFLALCRRHGLPRPEVNVRIGRRLVDFVWPAARLAVETDSYAFHRGSVAFEDDRARDLELRARGFEVHRFSELQVRNEPERVAADLVAALSRRTPASS